MNKIAESEVMSAIETALGLSPGSVTAESSMKNTDDWDSLNHLNILVALDTQFNGKVAEIEEMATANSVKNILSILRQHSLI